MKLIFSLLTFLVIYSDGSGDISKQEAEKAVIDKLKIEVKKLADGSVCSDEYKCFYVGIGSKPCGGFWEYIVYSNSIDIVSFLDDIEKLNALEKIYNKKYMIQSDCFMAMPPSSLECIEGKCVGTFQ